MQRNDDNDRFTFRHVHTCPTNAGELCGGCPWCAPTQEEIDRLPTDEVDFVYGPAGVSKADAAAEYAAEHGIEVEVISIPGPFIYDDSIDDESPEYDLHAWQLALLRSIIA